METPFPPQVSQHLEATLGYLELNMPQEAWEELDLVEEPYRHNPIILLGRVDIRMRQKRWEEAASLADILCHKPLEEPGAFISRSFCLHCLGRTQEAREKLLEAPSLVHQVPTYHYNLGCYECLLGNLDQARTCLIEAFYLEPALVPFAQSDPDVHDLRDELFSLSQAAKKKASQSPSIPS